MSENEKKSQAFETQVALIITVRTDGASQDGEVVDVEATEENTHVIAEALGAATTSQQYADALESLTLAAAHYRTKHPESQAFISPMVGVIEPQEI